MNDFFTKYPFAKDLAKLLLQALLVLAAGYGIMAPIQQQQREQTLRIEAQTEQVMKQNNILKAQLQLQEAEAAYWAIPTPARKP